MTKIDDQQSQDRMTSKDDKPTFSEWLKTKDPEAYERYESIVVFIFLASLISGATFMTLGVLIEAIAPLVVGAIAFIPALVIGLFAFVSDALEAWQEYMALRKEYKQEVGKD